MVYASTEGVYWDARFNGRYFKEPISEDMAAGNYPNMAYLLTKWLGEELAMTYCHQYGLPCCAMRFSTVIEPSEFLNEDGLPPRISLYSAAYATYSDAASYQMSNLPPKDQDDPDVQAIIDDLVAGWGRRREAAAEPSILTGRPTGSTSPMCAISPTAWPWRSSTTRLSARSSTWPAPPSSIGAKSCRGFAERYDMPFVEARLPFANYFELDLSKIKTLLGFQPRHDFDSILTTAEAIRRGETTDVLPTGVMFGEGLRRGRRNEWIRNRQN